jgi:hypothetical protein
MRRLLSTSHNETKAAPIRGGFSLEIGEGFLEDGVGKGKGDKRILGIFGSSGGEMLEVIWVEELDCSGLTSWFDES